MSLRLICHDGVTVRIPKEYAEVMPVLKNAEIVATRRYTLQSKASSELVGLLLDYIEDGTEVPISKDNFHDLQSLCRELGFTGLDEQLRVFNGMSHDVPLVKANDKETLDTTEQILSALRDKSKPSSKASSPVLARRPRREPGERLCVMDFEIPSDDVIVREKIEDNVRVGVFRKDNSLCAVKRLNYEDACYR